MIVERSRACELLTPQVGEHLAPWRPHRAATLPHRCCTTFDHTGHGEGRPNIAARIEDDAPGHFCVTDTDDSSQSDEHWLQFQLISEHDPGSYASQSHCGSEGVALGNRVPQNDPRYSM